MKKAILFYVIALLLSSCSALTRVSYDVGLSSVESPANAKKQFGETKVVNIEEDGIAKYHYEDDFIAITWYVSSTQFNFNLKNKSNYSIKINWDDISYVDYTGKVGRVMHSGVKYIERNNSQPSTTIPRDASISDILVPTDNVYHGSYGWYKTPLIPSSFKKGNEQQAQTYIGKKMTILMPIIIENVQNEYTFIFNIDDIIE